LRRLAIGILTLVSVLTIAGADAHAQTATDDANVVDVLQVSGLMDDILVSAVSDAIESAEADGSAALILQVNSRGTLVDDDRIEELLTQIAESPVAIGVWVGPTGARFYGTAAQILAVADVTAMSPGARVGYIGVPLSPTGADGDEIDIDFGVAAERLRNGSVGLTDARALDVFKQRIDDDGVPTITNMLQAMDGFDNDGTVLDTTEQVVADDGSTSFETVAVVRFSKLPLLDQLFHTVASPPVAYLLLLIGLSLIVFEFFTAGVGIAGSVGAGCLILACTGLATLPTRPWAVALIVLAMFAFAVDVQVGIPRFWTGVGLFLTTLGSLLLYDPIAGTSLGPSWIALVAGIGGVALTFIVGMPSMVRTRFATPTIGREWMIGEEGTAVDAVDPDGIVEVDGARWRARTNRATPIPAGERLRVAAIDGITLEVEPLEGAARDYRDRRSRSTRPAESLTADTAHDRPGSDGAEPEANPAPSGRDMSSS
jgi:membrane-bound serine protease (ClpP class)